MGPRTLAGGGSTPRSAMVGLSGNKRTTFSVRPGPLWRAAPFSAGSPAPRGTEAGCSLCSVRVASVRNATCCLVETTGARGPA